MTELCGSGPKTRNRFPLHRYLWNKIRRPSVVQLGQAKVHAVHASLSWRMTRSIRSGRYEYQERHLLSRLLRPTDRVLDIGAGIGLTSILCAQEVGCENVLSYEANTDLKPLIHLNFALNSLAITHIPKAMSTTDEPISMYFADDHWNSSVNDQSAKYAGEWRVVEADSIIRILDGFRPTLLLVDVEGFEVDLLAATRLDGVRGILIDMHPHIAGTERIDALRAHLGASGLSLTESCGGTEAYVRGG